MRYEVGDLVRIISSYDENKLCNTIAVVVKSYESIPEIFPQNDAENKKWIKEEGPYDRIVYDIICEGEIEKAVAGEWLRPFKIEK